MSHVTHETVAVPVGGLDWRVSSYSINDEPHVNAYYSVRGASLSLYFTPDEARAWRDAFDRVLAALPVEEQHRATELDAGTVRAEAL